ncbi:MAG: methyltransferase domain-containing protein [Desulfobulbaceae bacterium]|nr:MAG: methyltransferase domain-containing protein [Desulfobulbaceae bacterium]
MDVRALPESERLIYNNLKKKHNVHFEPLNVGDHRIRILMVSDLEELLDGKDPFEDVSSFPFWSKLWEAAIVLSHVLASAPERAGGRLLELGSGMGAIGLAAAAAGFSATLSDYDDEILDFARVSGAASGLENVNYITFDLLKPENIGTFDVITAAEILFKEELIDPVLAVCKEFLSEDGTVYLAHDVRRKCLPIFLEKAEAHFHIGTKKQTIRKNGIVSDILVNRLKKK